jgi:hypothetical protein
MRGDLYSGYVVLAGEFPPSLNTDADPTQLKPFESPDCYGVNCESDGLLRTGSIVSGTARASVDKTVGGVSYKWYYDRLWRSTGTDLVYGSPAIDNIFLAQWTGPGRFTCDASIVTYMPALDNQMWVCTATGSHLIRRMDDPRGFFELGRFMQELYAGTATHAMTLDGKPFVSNARGVFSYDGSKITEWTRPVRDGVTNFASKAITADYAKRFVVGASSFVVDTETGKLFDYATSGFRFTTRTLAQVPAFNPIQVKDVALVIKHGDTDGGTISWQSQIEDGDWYDEEDVDVLNDEGEYTRVTMPIDNPTRNGYRFRIRLTSLPSNIYVRQILVNVGGLAQGSFTE